MIREIRQETLHGALSSLSLDSIIRDFSDYISTLKEIYSPPRTQAASRILISNQNVFRKSVKVFLYGVALTFLTYIPVIVANGLTIDKIEFLLDRLHLVITFALSIHLSAKIFKGRANIYQTASVYCVWYGFSIPLGTLLNYPLFYYVAPDEFLEYKQEAGSVELPQWILIWTIIASIILIIAGFFYYFSGSQICMRSQKEE